MLDPVFLRAASGAVARWLVTVMAARQIMFSDTEAETMVNGLAMVAMLVWSLVNKKMATERR
jgi:hypothetical protein